MHRQRREVHGSVATRPLDGLSRHVIARQVFDVSASVDGRLVRPHSSWRRFMVVDIGPGRFEVEIAWVPGLPPRVGPSTGAVGARLIDHGAVTVALVQRKQPPMPGRSRQDAPLIATSETCSTASWVQFGFDRFSCLVGGQGCVWHRTASGAAGLAVGF
jgi:hypothetical protein